MRNIKNKTVLMAIFIASLIYACGSKNEAPKPKGDNNPPETNAIDTAAVFADKNWVIRKVSKDGVDDASNFLIGCSFYFFSAGGYLFTVPDFPSADGTWKFGENAKNKVHLMNQGPGTDWTILSIDEDNLVVEEQASNGLFKYEMSL